MSQPLDFYLQLLEDLESANPDDETNQTDVSFLSESENGRDDDISEGSIWSVESDQDMASIPGTSEEEDEENDEDSETDTDDDIAMVNDPPIRSRAVVVPLRPRIQYSLIEDDLLVQLLFLSEQRLAAKPSRRLLSAFLPFEKESKLQAMLDKFRGQRKMASFKCASCNSEHPETVSTDCCKVQTNGVVHLDVSRQVENILDVYIDRIVNDIEDIFEGQTVASPMNVPYLTRKVLMRGPPSEELHLSFAVTFDGFSTKGFFRGECWPVCLQLLNLPLEAFCSSTNTIMASLLVWKDHPNTIDLDTVFQEIHVQLRNLCSIRIGDKQLKVIGHMDQLICDDQGKRIAYNFVSAVSAKCCFHCMSDQTIYKWNKSTERCFAQSHREVVRDAEQGINGFRPGGYVPFLLNKVSIHDTIFDHLHTLGEGACKMLLKIAIPDMVGTSHIPLLNCSLDRRHVVSTMKQTRMPNGCPPFDMDQLNGTTGFINEMLFVYVLAPMMLSSSCDVRFVGAWVGIATISLILYSKDLEKHRHLLSYLGENTLHLLKLLHPKLCPFKTHVLLHHIATIVEEHGSPVMFSSNLAEQVNYLVHKNHNLNISRNSIGILANSFVELNEIRRVFENRLLTNPSVILRRYGHHWKRFPNNYRCREAQWIDPAILALFPGATYYDRYTVGGLKFSNPDIHLGKTQDGYFSFRDGAHIRYGKFLYAVEQGNTLIVLQKFDVSVTPYDNLLVEARRLGVYHSVESILHSASQLLLKGDFVNEVYSTNVSSIIGPMVLCAFNNNSFLVSCNQITNAK